jgi:hypothetical protein
VADRDPPTWAIVADYATRLNDAEKASAAQHRWWRNYIALMPYAVHREQTVRIPEQRRPAGREVPLFPPMSPIDRPRGSRFLDSRTTAPDTRRSP